MEKKRVIEVDKVWYYLSPDTPAEINSREELIKWSLGRGKPRALYGLMDSYQIEIRNDLIR